MAPTDAVTSPIRTGRWPAGGGLSNRLLRHFAGLTASEAVVRLLVLSVTLTVSRLLGPAALGQLSFAQAVIAYLVLATDAGLTTACLRDMVRRPERRADLVISATATQLLLALGLVGGIAVVASLAPLPTGTAALLLVGSPILVGQALNLLYVLQSRELMYAVARIKVTREVIGTSVALVLLIATRNLLWVAAGAWIGMFAGDALTWAVLGRAGDLRGRRPRTAAVRALLRRGSPFLGGALLGQLVVNLDVVVVALVRGTHDAGIYSAAFQPAYYLLLVAGIAVTAVFPQLVRRWETDRRGFASLLAQLIRLSTRFSVPLAGLVVIAAPELIELVYGGSFAESATVLRVVIALPLLGYHNTFAGQALMASGHQRRHLAVLAVAATVTVATVAALVPTVGVLGAAVSVVAAELGSLVLLSLSARRLLGIDSLSPFLGELPGGLAIAATILVTRVLIGPSLPAMVGVAIIAVVLREAVGLTRRR